MGCIFWGLKLPRGCKTIGRMDFEFYRLKNGVRVVLVPMAGVESVAVGVYVETGSRYETPKINGISHFLEHMVFKGTKKFPTHKDTSYLEGLGAIQNAWTGVDATCYWTKIPVDYWEKGLELVADLALNPTIPSRDLEIERGVILDEINRKEDLPDEIVGEVLFESMFAGNPLEMTIAGRPEVIKNLKREDFLEYHNRQYAAGRLVVAMAGKLSDLDRVKRQIQAEFEQLDPDKGGEFRPVREVQVGPRLKLHPKKLAAQAHIELAVRGVTVADPRRYALSLLTTYLGRGLSSRLFTEIREKRGMCYAVRADEDRWTDTGIWSVYAGLRIDKLAEAVEAIIGELARCKQDKLKNEELMQAKEKIRGPLLFSMENPVGQMEFYAKQVLDRPEEVLTHREVIDRVMHIDGDMIRKVAQNIFVTESLNLAVVGPVEAKEESRLAKLLKI